MPCLECEGPFPPLKCPHCGTTQRVDRNSAAWETAFLNSWASTALLRGDRGERFEEACRLADEAVLALREAREARLHIPPLLRGVEVSEALWPAQASIYRLWRALREKRPVGVAFYQSQLIRVLGEIPAESLDFRIIRARDTLINMPAKEIDPEFVASLEGAIFGGRLRPEAFPWPDIAPTEVTSEALHQVLEEVGPLVRWHVTTHRGQLNEFLDSQPDFLAALHIIGMALELPHERLRALVNESKSPLVVQWASDVMRAAPRYKPLEEVFNLLFVMDRAAAEGAGLASYRQDLVQAITLAAMLQAPPEPALLQATERVANTPAYEFSPQLVSELKALLYPLQLKP